MCSEQLPYGGERSMLQAMNQAEELVTPALMGRTYIEKLRNKDLFFCPACKRKVMMKAGQRMTPHFAHYPNDTCPAAAGGEGPYHEAGKLLLYRWLKAQGIATRLEPYLPELQQRPDLLIQAGGREIIIEYQCARIAKAGLLHRMLSYKDAGYEQLWILGGNRLKRKSTEKLSIDAFTGTFIHKFSRNKTPALYFFCPHTLQTAVFQNPIYCNASAAIASARFKKLPEIRLPELIQTEDISLRQLAAAWTREKQQLRLNRQTKVYGQERLYRQWLYRNNAYLETLPSTVYLPVKSQHLMTVPPWNWQSRISLELLLPLKAGSMFTFKACHQRVRQFFRHPAEFLLFESGGCPVHEYIEQLEVLEYIQELSPGVYRLEKPIEFPQNVEHALYEDEVLMNKWLENLKNQNTSMNSACSDIL